MEEYRIGNLVLKSRVLLAPMLEPNDIAFRLLCKKAGCALTYTGMISPLSKQKLDLGDKPMLQLFGNSVRGIASFMKKYDSQVSGWDFNLGCPSKLSKKLEHGAFMAAELDLIRDILKTMRKNTKKPLTVKIRKSDFAFDILKITEEIGLDGICVHARTSGQGYSGEVDYDFALEIKKRSGIPVIFSGVSDLSEINSILKDFNFVMVGRKAIGNPGIFGKEIGFNDYLKLAKKYRFYFRQVKYQAMNWTKGVMNGKDLRIALAEAKNIEDIEKIIG